MSYESRLDAIAKLLPKPEVIRLYFEDGSESEVTVPPGEDLLGWVVRLMHSPNDKDAQSIKRSIVSVESSGGHLTDIIRVAPDQESQDRWNAEYEQLMAERDPSEQPAAQTEEEPMNSELPSPSEWPQVIQ